MYETIGDRIRAVREARGMSQAELAKRMGVVQQTGAKYESAGRDMRSGTIARLAQALDTSIAFLLGQTDAMEIEPIYDGGYVAVPYFGRVAAGTPITMEAADDTREIPADVRGRFPDSFLLLVTGESMNRILPDGCYALIDPCETIDHPGKPYAICVNGFDATIKRVRQLSNGIELIPDSLDPTYHTQTFDYGDPDTPDITVIGRVVWYCLPADWEF